MNDWLATRGDENMLSNDIDLANWKGERNEDNYITPQLNALAAPPLG